MVRDSDEITRDLQVCGEKQQALVKQQQVLEEELTKARARRNVSIEVEVDPYRNEACSYRCPFFVHVEFLCTLRGLVFSERLQHDSFKVEPPEGIFDVKHIAWRTEYCKKVEVLKKPECATTID